MVIHKIKAIAVAKARVARLEKSISRELGRELAGLPVKFGFGDVDAFIGAVKAAAGGKAGRGRPAKAAAPAKRRKRATITDAIRAKVKKLVDAGKTGSQIAAALKISQPSVQNIKKALGLVRSAKKATPKAKAKSRRIPAKRSTPPKPRKKSAAPKKVSPPAPEPSEPADPAPAPSA